MGLAPRTPIPAFAVLKPGYACFSTNLPHGLDHVDDRIAVRRSRGLQPPLAINTTTK